MSAYVMHQDVLYQGVPATVTHVAKGEFTGIYRVQVNDTGKIVQVNGSELAKNLPPEEYAALLVTLRKIDSRVLDAMCAPQYGIPAYTLRGIAQVLAERGWTAD